MDDGDCVSFEDIDLQQDLYVVETPGGGTKGFAGFDDFAQYESTTYGMEFDSESDLLSAGGGTDISDQGPTDPDEPTDGDCPRGHHSQDPDDPCYDDNSDSNDDNCPQFHHSDDPCDADDGPHHFVTARMKASAATFFDRSDMSGEGIMLAPGDFISNLKSIPKVSGGSWDNQISSWIIEGGKKGKQAGGFCINAFCTDGLKMLFNDTQIALPKKLNNQISAIRLF